MVNENREIFRYKNRNNEDIIGILHKPDNGKKKDVIVILLNPGLKSRVGPHRLYVKITERLTELGLNVFRYDSHGIGESGGEIIGSLKEVLHDQVLSGALVPDVLDTVSFLEEKTGFKKVILMGLCGGAMTTLQAASHLKSVEAIIMLGLPVTFVGKNE